MMIVLLAAVMVVAMLVATALALHGEAQNFRIEARRHTRFG